MQGCKNHACMQQAQAFCYVHLQPRKLQSTFALQSMQRLTAVNLESTFTLTAANILDCSQYNIDCSQLGVNLRIDCSQ